MRWRWFVPLLAYAVPTIVVGYGWVIPASCIAGVNELTIGFASAIAGACLTYVAGVRAVVHDLSPSGLPKRHL